MTVERIREAVSHSLTWVGQEAIEVYKKAVESDLATPVTRVVGNVGAFVLDAAEFIAPKLQRTEAEDLPK